MNTLEKEQELERYGKLTVIGRAGAPSHVSDKKAIYYLCKCDCGNIKIIKKGSLIEGRTVSCGCHAEEKTIMVKMGGVEYSLNELSRKYRISIRTLYERYRSGLRGGYLVEPVEPRTYRPSSAIRTTVNGKEYESLSRLQLDYPYVSVVTLAKRYKKGLRDLELVKRPRKI
jgi:hypothetical protein